MKKLILILLFIVPLYAIQAQDRQKKEKSLTKKERKAKQAEEVKQMMNDRNFVYRPTQANPMGGSTVRLDFSFSTEVQGDTIHSYMPYYGRAYSVDYGTRKGPFDFTLPTDNYTFKKVKNGYLVSFDVKNGQDNLSYNFNISENGYASLTIVSTNRQAISYYGTLEKPEKKDDKLSQK